MMVLRSNLKAEYLMVLTLTQLEDDTSEQTNNISISVRKGEQSRSSL